MVNRINCTLAGLKPDEVYHQEYSLAISNVALLLKFVALNVQIKIKGSTKRYSVFEYTSRSF